MSNVSKTCKKKLINIDTKFRDEYNYSQLSNYNITLPERINEVKSMRIVCAEIPITFYNISAALGNNCFYISDDSPIFRGLVTIPDGNYTASELANTITNLINAQLPNNINYSFSVSSDVGSKFIFSFTLLNKVTINFAVDSKGNPDKYNFKSKLGWIMGFRNPTYTVSVNNSVNPINLTSEAFMDMNGPKYLYLAIDEFNKGNQTSFIPPLYNSLVNKNIIARISLDNAVYGFGTILPANNYNALLTTDVRSYTGKIDLMKLNVQLLTENGLPVNLNGMDFSFCMEVVHE